MRLCNKLTNNGCYVQSTKTIEDNIVRLKEEIISLKRGLEEASDVSSANNDVRIP